MNNSMYNQFQNEFIEDDDDNPIIKPQKRQNPPKADSEENESSTKIRSKTTRPFLVMTGAVLLVTLIFVIAISVALASAKGVAPTYGCLPLLSSAELKIGDRLITVPCEDGWIVMQRRGQFKYKENFYRSFAEYEKDFGDVEGEFWMGLENIANITAEGSWELRVDITDWDKKKYFSRYGSFRVGPAPRYVLKVGLFDRQSSGGDSLTNDRHPKWAHNGMAFTTKDRDRDSSGRYNCAILKKGGWWYNECYQSNLNGINYSDKRYSHSGVTWEFGGLRGDGLYNVMEASMKIRKKS